MRVTGYPEPGRPHRHRPRPRRSRGGLVLAGRRLQVLSLSYKPHHVIAVLPGEQVVATPYDTVRATSDLLRGSVIFRPTPRLELDHATFEIEGMRLSRRQRLDRRHRQGDPRHPPGRRGTPFAHDVAFDAEGLALPAESTVERHRRRAARPTIGPVGLDATLAFDRPWDRPAIEGDNPVLEGVEVRDLRLDLGQARPARPRHARRRRRGLRRGPPRPARPQLARDARRRRGRAARSTRRSPARSAPASTSSPASAATATRSSVPLDFPAARTRLGPIPLGPAPRLAQR